MNAHSRHIISNLQYSLENITKYLKYDALNLMGALPLLHFSVIVFFKIKIKHMYAHKVNSYLLITCYVLIKCTSRKNCFV